MGHVLGLARMRLYIEFERPVSEAELGALRELVRRRGRREPVQHILGFTEFCGLRLKTDRRALIPRPETELLVEIGRGQVRARPRRASWTWARGAARSPSPWRGRFPPPG